MALLIITTILWAFSFSFYGEYLAGHVDSYFAVLPHYLRNLYLFIVIVLYLVSCQPDTSLQWIPVNQRVFHCGATYHHHDSVGLLL